MDSPRTPPQRNDAVSPSTSNEDPFWDAGDFFSPHRTPLDRIRSPSPPVQNIFHPVKNLPWETLARIFIFYYQWTIEDFTRSNQHWTVRRPKPYSWFAIRHVCRLWRDVALNYPFLNTHVVLANPACVADQVARSGQLPLHVYAVHDYRNVRAENMTESCRIIFQHAPRIHSIMLQYTPALDNALQDPAFAAVQLPNVERIVTNFGGPGLLQGVPSGKVFPARPFEKTQFESLASCVYERATPSYLIKALHGKPVRHTLQYLEIKDAVTVPVKSSKTPTFINTLAQLTGLRELILQIKLDRILPQSARVTLPHLNLLVLHDVDNTHNASAFLGRILFPPSAKIVIKSMEKDIRYLVTDADIIRSKYVGGTTANGSPLGLPSFMEIAIYSWPQRVEFSFWQKGQIEKVDPSRVDPPALSWQVDTADDLDDSGDHLDLNMLMERLPVEGLRGVFIILHAKQVLKTDWEKWMSDIGDSLLPLATLQVLGIDGYQIARSVVAAMERARFPRGTMLPRLQQLHIRDTSGRLARSDSGFGHVLERLGKIAIKRRDEGHRLQQLKIETRRTGSDDVDALSRGEAFIRSETVVQALESLTYSTEVGATSPIDLVTVMAATIGESQVV